MSGLEIPTEERQPDQTEYVTLGEAEQISGRSRALILYCLKEGILRGY